ncbi:hypothetical protein [Synechococcus sp. PCC 7335]|uniref:hypothetical protein n=1 Tax=Synechococcus sp. (strain ATCC 29403 / PCC 7335) TaxID=91464 RepID=UPI0012F92C91|nr:hypothetical protein [Synechococcus sp. PCC 7335]
MTVEVYKPALKPRPVPSVLTPPVVPIRAERRAVVDIPARQDSLVFKPMQPRLDLVVGIEEMMHPDRPSFAELEALVIAEGLL